VRDRDALYGRDFAAKAGGVGIDTLLTPFRAPRANAVAEQVIRSLRQECLDHVLPLGERYLECVLSEYVRYYNTDRPHRSLGLTPPLPSVRAPAAPSAAGPVTSRPVLGGLHHAYARAA
jgi:transposase InsO family protein